MSKPFVVKSKNEIDVIESRFKKINTGFTAVIKNFATEDIHRFRVEIKKLRATIHAINAGTAKYDKLKLPKRLKKFYSAIGIIRNLQLQQERIIKIANETESTLPAHYLTLLRAEATENIQKAKKIFKSQKSFKKEEEKIKEILERDIETIHAKKFLTLEAKLLSEQELLIDQKDDRALHTIRKILKDILYTEPFISKKTQFTLPPWLSSKKEAQSLTDMFGNFQDACVGLSFLQPFYLNQIPEDERILLLNVEKEWQDDKEKMKNEIHDLFKKNDSFSKAKNDIQALAIFN